MAAGSVLRASDEEKLIGFEWRIPVTGIIKRFGAQPHQRGSAAARDRRGYGMKICLALATVLLLSACAGAPPQQAQQSGCYHYSEAAEKDIGYCAALRRGNTLYVSGVPARGEMPAAIRTVYDRLGQILAANGLTFADVVKENVYAVDLDAFIKSKDVRHDYYGDKLPAATWVQVQRLYLPAFVVEVELTAQIPPGQ